MNKAFMVLSLVMLLICVTTKDAFAAFNIYYSKGTAFDYSVILSPKSNANLSLIYPRTQIEAAPGAGSSAAYIVQIVNLNNTILYTSGFTTGELNFDEWGDNGKTNGGSAYSVSVNVQLPPSFTTGRIDLYSFDGIRLASQPVSSSNPTALSFDNTPMTLSVSLSGQAKSFQFPLTMTADNQYLLSRFTVLGDVTHDGFVTPVDSLTVISYINSGAPLADHLEADVNGDGYLSPADALTVTSIINSGVNRSIPKGASLNNNIFTWAPTADQVGTYQLVFYVEDDNKKTLFKKNVTLTVQK